MNIWPKPYISEASTEKIGQVKNYLMKFIDSHAHIFLPEFDKDRDDVILRATKNDVKHILLPNIDASTLPDVISCCREYENICFPLLGLHPGSVNRHFEDELKVIRTGIESYQPLGIGEIGLDFYWDTTYADEQKKCFEIQLQWAKELKLPVAIHVRNSHNEVIKIISRNQDKNLQGVFHCFTGNDKEATEILELGFYIGIGGIVTFKNSGLREVLKKIPPERILIETDSPYLAPVPFRGKRNESSYLIYILECLSSVYDENKEKLSEIIFENTKKLFFTRT